jgi:hypothetical protein
MSFNLIDSANDLIPTSYTFTRNGETDPLIQLKLNEDQTFVFFDKSDSAKQIMAEGKYLLKGQKILLYDYSSNERIASKWFIDKRYSCIKSRKGLQLTRICECDGRS